VHRQVGHVAGGVTRLQEGMRNRGGGQEGTGSSHLLSVLAFRVAHTDLCGVVLRQKGGLQKSACSGCTKPLKTSTAELCCDMVPASKLQCHCEALTPPCQCC
jgi:hypothetical protein